MRRYRDDRAEERVNGIEDISLCAEEKLKIKN